MHVLVCFPQLLETEGHGQKAVHTPCLAGLSVIGAPQIHHLDQIFHDLLETTSAPGLDWMHAK